MKQRLLGKCGGRTLERLLLGEAAKRPTYSHGSTKDEKQGPKATGITGARVSAEQASRRIAGMCARTHEGGDIAVIAHMRARAYVKLEC